jgi:cytidylate kinase
MENLAKITIALDGPAGAGKSTVARLVAQKLKLVYINTGSMYRAVAWLILKNNLDLNLQKKEILELVEKAEILLTQDDVFINGQQITEQIREPEISRFVSPVSAMSEIRTQLVKLQQALGKNGGVILDGRDIGTTVFPEADLKVFLVASSKERALRRQKQQMAGGIEQSLEEVQAEIEKRDYLDCNREISPLRQASDAILVDTDNLSIKQVVDKIIDLAQKSLN